MKVVDGTNVSNKAVSTRPKIYRKVQKTLPQNVLAQSSRLISELRACSIHASFYKREKSESRTMGLLLKRRTIKSFGVFLASGSFSRQLSMKLSASFGYRPSGVSRGAGSFTMCCKSSKMLIVMPPPCRLTPLLFLLSFFGVVRLIRAGGRPESEIDPGRAGESVPSYSESESSEVDSENGKRPRASSIKEIPSDHTSDLTVYCAPCIRSGCYDQANLIKRREIEL